MPWKKRKNQRPVFTVNKRVNGEHLTFYYGSGPRAHLAAELDDARAQRRRDSQLLLAEFDAIMHAMDENFANLKLLTAAHLLVRGYYMHHGQWRRRRKKRTDSE